MPYIICTVRVIINLDNPNIRVTKPLKKPLSLNKRGHRHHTHPKPVRDSIWLLEAISCSKYLIKSNRYKYVVEVYIGGLWDVMYRRIGPLMG